jgi:cell division protein FtsW
MKWSDLLLFFCVFSIFSLGVVMVFGTSSAETLDLSLEKSTHKDIYKHISYGILGVIAALSIRTIGYRSLVNLSFPLFLFFTFLLILTFVPYIGKMRNGSHRWIGFAGYTLQPSEFIKYLIPLFYIYSMTKEEFSIKGLAKTLSWIAVPIFLILLEPDNGTVAIIGVSISALLFLSRVKFKYWAWPLLLLIAIGGCVAYNMPYVTQRLKVYANPQLDLRGRGHQPYQAKIAAGSGEFWGRGAGKSLQKLSYLPEAQNDFIAAIYAEEFGFFGIVVLISLYIYFSYLGTKIALEAVSLQGMYLAAIITFLISFQAFLNLGVVSGLLPSTGLNLPFFSQGGSSLIANVMAIGVLISISEEKRKKTIINF